MISSKKLKATWIKGTRELRQILHRLLGFKTSNNILITTRLLVKIQKHTFLSELRSVSKSKVSRHLGFPPAAFPADDTYNMSCHGLLPSPELSSDLFCTN